MLQLVTVLDNEKEVIDVLPSPYTEFPADLGFVLVLRKGNTFGIGTPSFNTPHKRIGDTKKWLHCTLEHLA